jgi:predicted amidophosphoribosyltransferase
MKKQWKKEQKICCACHDKAVIDRNHDRDLCPRCARDLENKMMAQALSEEQRGELEPALMAA